MSKVALSYVLSLFSTQTRDFSVFVSDTSKHEKERLLRLAANRAIKQQRRMLEEFSSTHK